MSFVDEMSRKDVYEKLRYLKPDRSFRESYEYCNMPFMITGYLEERLCGKTWEELVRDNCKKNRIISDQLRCFVANSSQ